MNQEKLSRRRKWLKRILYLLLLVCIVAVVSHFIFTKQKDVQLISCASNLTSLGLSMQQYAMDFNDCFPDKNGVAGLDILRREGYCSDLKIYLCPASGMTEAGSDQPFRSSYEYLGGLKATPEDAEKVLMWDKCGNHQNCCNVLFCDDHVETISYKNGKIVCERFFKGRLQSSQPAPFDVSKLPPEIIRAVSGK